MSSNLIKAIRSGQLTEVVAVLDADSSIELNDANGSPGLPLVMACLLGHAEIARELLIRGAAVNLGDNSVATSPLSTAVRAKKTEVVKVLIEHGAQIPEGMKTGLRKDELMLARWKAEHFGAFQSSEDYREPDIEVIQVNGGFYGTNTDVLDAEMKRAVRELSRSKKQEKPDK